MDKTKEKEIEELLHKDIEEKSRIEMQPVPPSQLDCIERMLRWIIIKNQIDYFANVGMHGNDSQIKRCRKNIKSMTKQLPDISGIIEQKTKKPDVSNAIFLLEGALIAIMGHSKRKDKDEQVDQITNALVILNKYGKHEKIKAGD